jgi:hypothetical protein
LARLIDEYWKAFLRMFNQGWLRTVCLTLYYLAIIVGLILLYGKGDFSMPKFIYQGF